MPGLPAACPGNQSANFTTFLCAFWLASYGKVGHFSMLLTAVIRLLEVLFVVGAVGSGIVVLMTAVEDIKMLFMRDEKAIRTGQD
jgi:hypothetical protein